LNVYTDTHNFWDKGFSYVPKSEQTFAKRGTYIYLWCRCSLFFY